MVEDPLEQLLRELLAAHDRMVAGEPQATPPAGKRRRGAAPRRGRRAIAGVPVVAMILAAAATAAVVIAVSLPLAGRLPPQLLGTSYALRVAPDLRAGHAGWCVSLLDISASDTLVPVPAECVSGQGPLIARGGIVVISPRSGATRGQLLYAIVDRSVRALREPGGATLRPIVSGALPAGWRAAVTIQTNLPRAPRSRGRVVELSPVSASGAALGAAAHRETVLATRRAPLGAGFPAAGCRLLVHRQPGVTVGSARELAVTAARRAAVSGALLSCFSAGIDADGGQSVAAVLVAGGSSRAAPVIPGFRPLRGSPGVWVGPRSAGPSDNGELEHLLARRAGRGWLLLQTPISTTMALALLHGISASS